ncbi:MAG: hypothetical protein M0Z85_00255, partial [Gammaproteobacteria bacterium]|nr:hypothetical protein [Gammaproteobacteria bacterium]
MRTCLQSGSAKITPTPLQKQIVGYTAFHLPKFYATWLWWASEWGSDPLPRDKPGRADHDKPRAAFASSS